MITMVEFLTPLIDFISRDQAAVKIIVTLLILTTGHLTVKAFKLFIKKTWIKKKKSENKKQIKRQQENLKYTGYLLDSIVILAALIYLDTGITQDLSQQLATFLPQILSAALIVLLGVIVIQLVTRAGEKSMKRAGLQNYLREIGFSISAVNIISKLIKAFLYLILIQITLSELGIGETFANELIHASSWAAAFLAAALIFYGFKDLFVNLAAGIYLKNSENIRPGEEVEIEGEKTEIRRLSLFSTSLDTKTGQTIISPNKEIAESRISFKRTKNDLNTLEEITSYFTSEDSDSTLPASLEMTLEIFGYRKNQQEIKKNIKGEEAEEVTKAVREMTNNEVKSAFVESHKITDVSNEFKTWFNDGALTITELDRSELFSEESGSSHVLSLAVEEDEILVVDPSTMNGGVYFVSKERFQKAVQTSSAGYFVLAPEGTTAHWRIKNNLIYSDKNYYDEISKTLESRLVKIMRKGRLLRDAMPASVDKYIANWQKNGEVTHLWSPEE